jgi:Leucine-rich repeat (LRR) protein
LAHLVLSANALSEIPTDMALTIASYKRLEFLDVASNGLCAWPKEFDGIERLRQVVAPANKLTSMLCLNRGLEIVDLQQNQGTAFPELSPTVRSVAFDFNRLTTLAIGFDSLARLTVALNSITAIGTLRLPNLEFLDISRNRIAKLPSFAHLSRLRALDCSDNFVTEVPEFPASLRQVSFRHNLLNAFPDIRSMCPHFVLLGCGENEISSLPEFPPTTASLFFNNNKLEAVPACDLPELRRMFAAHNQLVAMLPYRGNGIEEYLMPHNLMREIDVGLLSAAVTRLDLSENRIAELPPELFQLPKLDILVLARNRIQQFRRSGDFPG